jgi:hypothetical protein
MKRTIVAGLLAASACGVHAAEFRPLVKAGVDFRGETLVTAVFADGETETMKANEGFYFGGGLAVIEEARRFELHATVAYKFGVINASNGEIEWTRFPLEVLAFYRFQKVRVGGGLTYHLSPRLEGDGVVGGLDVRFKDALGALLQVDWLFTQNLAVGARYTVLKYEAEGAFRGDAHSKGLGVTFSYSFSR